MATRISEIYTDEVHENLSPLYANWEPGTPRRLGNYGVLDGNTFIYVGNIKDLDIHIKVRHDTTPDKKSFTTQGSTQVRFGIGAGGTVDGAVDVAGKLEVAFSSERAVFFNAAGCRTETISDQNALGQAIMALRDADKWNDNWAVVTDIVKAGATTVAVSGGAGSSVTFQASGTTAQIDLADADLDLHVASQNNIGYTVDAGKGLVPLIGLSKVQSRFPLFWNKDFKPALARRPGAEPAEEQSGEMMFGEVK